MADTDREEINKPDPEGEEIIIEGPEDEKDKTEESCGTAGETEEAAGEASGETAEEETAGEETSEEAPEETGSEAGEAEEAAEETGDKEEEAEDASDSKDKHSDAAVRWKLEEEKFKKQVDDLTDRLRRSLAEFDNFRKRTDKEKSSMYEIGARDIVEKILPVLDNFERGLAAAPEDDKFAEGIRMIYKQLVTVLTDAGVKPIEAVGQPFDPELHNAVMHVEDENLGENVVAEEFQKGYLYKDHVVRHSMVKVAN